MHAPSMKTMAVRHSFVIEDRMTQSAEAILTKENTEQSTPDADAILQITVRDMKKMVGCRSGDTRSEDPPGYLPSACPAGRLACVADAGLGVGLATGGPDRKPRRYPEFEGIEGGDEPDVHALAKRLNEAGYTDAIAMREFTRCACRRCTTISRPTPGASTRVRG